MEPRAVDEAEFVNLPIDEAMTRAEQAGWASVRRYGPGPTPLTMDYRWDRLNLEVDEDGRVASAKVF